MKVKEPNPIFSWRTIVVAVVVQVALQVWLDLGWPWWVGVLMTMFLSFELGMQASAADWQVYFEKRQKAHALDVAREEAWFASLPADYREESAARWDRHRQLMAELGQMYREDAEKTLTHMAKSHLERRRLRLAAQAARARESIDA